MKIKSLLMLLLSLVISLNFVSFAFASSNDEYIKFNNNPNTRMDSDGNFDFQIRSSVKSDTFTADSDEITINISGEVWDSQNKVWVKTSDTFSVTLYTSLGFKVGDTFTVNCNGRSVSKSFDVTEGKKYYFQITANKSYSGTAYYIIGDGCVSPVTP